MATPRRQLTVGAGTLPVGGRPRPNYSQEQALLVFERATRTVEMRQERSRRDAGRGGA